MQSTLYFFKSWAAFHLLGSLSLFFWSVGRFLSCKLTSKRQSPLRSMPSSKLLVHWALNFASSCVFFYNLKFLYLGKVHIKKDKPEKEKTKVEKKEKEKEKSEDIQDKMKEEQHLQTPDKNSTVHEAPYVPPCIYKPGRRVTMPSQGLNSRGIYLPSLSKKKNKTKPRTLISFQVQTCK